MCYNSSIEKQGLIVQKATAKIKNKYIVYVLKGHSD